MGERTLAKKKEKLGLGRETCMAKGGGESVRERKWEGGGEWISSFLGPTYCSCKGGFIEPCRGEAGEIERRE